MMGDLLKLLVLEYGKKENWIGNAAEVIFAKMEHCLTGNTVIKDGAKDFLPYSKAFGSKQGGLGGIRNDTAFLHLNDGRWVIFFFQAEDGIRDGRVTGVQTCALPI